MKVFITGDRSLPAEVALLPVSVFVIKALRDDPNVEIMTGDNLGVESAVALLGLVADFPVTVVASPLLEGKVDWDARHVSLLEDPEMRILFLHGDHLASRIGKSLVQYDDDRVTFVVPALA